MRFLSTLFIIIIIIIIIIITLQAFDSNIKETYLVKETPIT